ncbi:hypothetical protein DFQ27_003250 [Actinomortierella ambigua]|uniref:CRAL-TRIO domain-containing protein n=1 Tax=Actinomortierella ambigua TaxID=1343610 RepID=A0A9P6Q8Q0_9FUNG|nr:hypothetical protein DFQ27_003250 [Actinomortierella ambigua]
MNSAERSTQQLVEQYQEQALQVTELQQLLLQLYPHTHPAHQLAASYIHDRITMFRFLKKANYNLKDAHALVEANLHWRMASRCDQITPRDMDNNVLWQQGLVQLRGQDRYGHPLMVIRLGQYIPAPTAAEYQPDEDSMDEDEDQDHGDASSSSSSSSTPPPLVNLQAGDTLGRLDRRNDRFYDYKRYIIFVLECLRKMLWETSRRLPTEQHALQTAVILDLQGTAVSDLDHQLITYMIDLLKNRYPSSVAQVYVLNYSWVFGGIWQMLKRALPETARSRVSFPSAVEELHEHIDKDELSVEFGGVDDYSFDSDSCDAFHYFGYPMVHLQAPGTPTKSLSRVNSSDSIYYDAVSSTSTPMHSPGLRPLDSLGFLSMTPMMPAAHHHHASATGHGYMRRRSNSIPTIDITQHHDHHETDLSLSATTHHHQHHHHQHYHHHNKSTPMRASLLKHSKSTAHIPSFMMTPSIETDLPTSYPLGARHRRRSIHGGSGAKMITGSPTTTTTTTTSNNASSVRRTPSRGPRGVRAPPGNGLPRNGRSSMLYRLFLRPDSMFMRIVASQQKMQGKVVAVIKRCADKMLRGDAKSLLYWVLALIVMRGEVWQLIAGAAVKVLTAVGEGEDIFLVP